ncbi:major facilitator superfamily domain-containing protein [Xylariaceae sp. FL1272]|nr:major facilitator superfamily domain-containing protein [Xylariaceae sp. FL1272]
MSLATAQHRRSSYRPDEGPILGDPVQQPVNPDDLTRDAPAADAVQAPAEKPGFSIEFWLAFWSLAFISLAASLDSATLALAIPTISRDLSGGGDAQAFWAGTSYLLANTGTLALWCSLSDAVGRRPTLFACIVLLTAGSIVCARATSYAILIAGRTIQGVGGGGILGLTYVVMTDLVPLRSQPKFSAMLNALTALGSVTGPIIGGACAASGNWPWIFWLNLPICVLSAVGLGLFLRLQRQQARVVDQLRQLDWLGSGLFIVFLTVFLVPVTMGGLVFAWDSWQTLVPLLLGVAGLVFVGVHQRYLASRPFVPRQIFANGYDVAVLFFGSFSNGLILFGLVYYVPEYFLGVKGYSSLVAGAATLPTTLTAIPCAIGTSVGMARTGRYRWALNSGWAVAIVGIALLIVQGVDTSVPAWVFLNLAAAVGTGMLLPATNIGLQASVSQDHVAMSTTLVLFFRSFGKTVGVAIGNPIVDNVLRSQLQSDPNVPSAYLGLSSVEVVGLLNSKASRASLDPALVHALKSGLVAGFRALFGSLAALALVNFLLQLRVREFSLNRAHKTKQGWVDLKERDRRDELELTAWPSQRDAQSRTG